MTFRNILIINNLVNNKYVNNITDYFKFNKYNKFILSLMKNNRFQNTIFVKGLKLYNVICLIIFKKLYGFLHENYTY